MALAASPINERKRVKVYELRENDWYDKGTGFCVVQAISEEGRICVESEDEPQTTLLEVKVKKDDNYQKQQETLIVWTDQEGVDMALSFQEADGCGIVWNTISEAQEKLDGPVTTFTPIALPAAELGNLEEIENVVRGASNTQQGRDALAKVIISDNYIARLTALVSTAEDLEDLPDLHRLCNIMKTLILFNDNQIIEYIVRDEVILGAVGALEYDPDFPYHKANHRHYLKDSSKYKEVVPIEDEDIRRKIHFTYRLQYLKDVALARILDDPSFSLFNSMIYFHQIDIVQHIATNAPFLNELFSIISNPESATEKKKDAVAFLQQSCAVAKGLQAPCRASLFHNLINSGLFATITFALQHRDPAVRVAGTDILVAVIDHDVLMMRTNIYKSVQDKTKPMTDTLIDLLLVETDLGVKAQVADAIKVLLDSSPNGGPPDRLLGNDNSFVAKARTSAAASSQTDAFLATFFDQSAKKLFQPLKDLAKRESLSNLSIHEVSLYSHLVEILCFFIRQHSYRSKYFILHESLALRTAQLMACPEKHLKLTAIKFFRTCISLQDEHHTRQLIQNHLFEPLLDIIHETMPRDNLLNSACLDIFEFIRKEGIKPIILHLVDNYRERLQAIDYVDVFHGILVRYEHYMNPTPPNLQANNGEMDSSFMTSEADTPNTRHVTINGGGTRWQGLKDTDADEEAYFNADDDNDDEDEEDELSRDHALPNGASPLAKPLVDYGDDDDDEEEEAEDADAAVASGQDETAVVTETPPSRKVTRPDNFLDEPSSSPQTPTPTPSDKTATVSPSTGGTAPSSTPPPPPSLAEKRRREEDDDDELGKLSKRRSSSSSLLSVKRDGSASWDGADTDLAVSPSELSPEKEAESTPEDPLTEDAENDGDKDVDKDSGTPRQQTLRRKRGFATLHGGSGNVGGAGGGRKIAISLAGANAGAGKSENGDTNR